MSLVSICFVFVAVPFLRQAADGYLQSTDVNVISNVLRAVSANDMIWYHILSLTIKVNRSALNAHVHDMLDELNVKGELAKVHQVVSYVVSHAGATGSQKKFGARVLGTGVWCQLIGTLLVHTKITSYYGRRAVMADNIRLRLSKIQMTLPVYLEKLSFFDESIGELITFNKMINATFALHDKNPKTDKKIYNKHLLNMCNYLKMCMKTRCGVTDESAIGDRLKINSYDSKVFSDRSRIDDHQLLTMIDDLDGYNFIEIKTMEVKNWINHLKIVEFKQKGSELVNASANDEED